MTRRTEQNKQAEFKYASEGYKNSACKLQEKMLEAGGIRKFLIEKDKQDIVSLYRRLQELLKTHYFPEQFSSRFLSKYRAWKETGKIPFERDFERLGVLLEPEIKLGDMFQSTEIKTCSFVDSGKLLHSIQSALQNLKELQEGKMSAPGVRNKEWAEWLILTFGALEKIRRLSTKMLENATRMNGISQEVIDLRCGFLLHLVELLIHFDFIILETIDNPMICYQVDPAKELRKVKPKVYMEQLVESRENLGLSIVALLEAIKCCIGELSGNRVHDGNI